MPDERRVDPGGRDGCRAPLPWEPGRRHGWPATSPGFRGRLTPDSRNATSRTGEPAVDAPPLPRSARDAPGVARTAPRHGASARGARRTCSPTSASGATTAASCSSTSATTLSTCLCPSHGTSRWPALSSQAPGHYRRTARHCSDRRSERRTISVPAYIGGGVGFEPTKDRGGRRAFTTGSVGSTARCLDAACAIRRGIPRQAKPHLMHDQEQHEKRRDDADQPANVQENEDDFCRDREHGSYQRRSSLGRVVTRETCSHLDAPSSRCRRAR